MKLPNHRFHVGIRTKYTQILAIIVILGFIPVAKAGLLPEAQKVQAAYTKLTSEPSNASNQLAYLVAFPNNYEEFMSVFMPSDFKQLYGDSHEHFLLLADIGKQFPEQTLDRLLPIEAIARWDADALNDLQEVTISIAMDNPKIFAKCLFKQSKMKRDGVVQFLADGIEGPHPFLGELANRVERAAHVSLAKQIRHEAAISTKRANREHER